MRVRRAETAWSLQNHFWYQIEKTGEKQDGRCALKRPMKYSNLQNCLFFFWCFSNDTSETAPIQKGGEYSRGHSLPSSSPSLLSTNLSLEAIRCCTLYNDKHFTSGAKAHQNSKARWRSSLTKKTRAHAWLRMTPEVVFCMKGCFFYSLSFVSVSPSFLF